ncbi:MAG: alpha/beta hydrolase [Pseudomonadota bacterium]
MSWTKLGLSALTNTVIILGIGATLTYFGGEYRAKKAERTHAPLGEFVEVDGGRVHYVQEGSGPHVILLHGAGGNLREFTFDLMGRLTDKYTVTAFDRPGLGYTDRVPGVPTGLIDTEGASPQAQAAMLRDAAAILGIENPIVAGHSFGGIVSYAWAVAGLDEESPVNASAVVSMAGVTMPWPGDLGSYYTLNGSPFGGVVTIPLIAALAPEGRINEGIEAIFAPQSVPEGYSDYVGARLALRPDTLRANIRQVNTLRPHVVDMATRYPELTLPIEIIHGDMDMTVPISIHPQELIKIVPSANLTTLEGVGHMPHQADPEATVAAIDRAAARAASQ